MDPTTARAELEPADSSGPRRDAGLEAAAKKDDESSQKAPIKKRTKTGCMTCRKRRIKCDEGKPTCNNCIKSKRVCEGYNQRLVFKEPISAFHGGPYGHVLYHPPPPESAVNAQVAAAAAAAAAAASAAHARSNAQGPLPAIAPKPPMLDFVAGGVHQYGGPYPSPPRAAPAPASPGVLLPHDFYVPPQDTVDVRYQLGPQHPSPGLPSPPHAHFGQQIQQPQSDFPHHRAQLLPGQAGQFEVLSPVSPPRPLQFVSVDVEGGEVLSSDSGAAAGQSSGWFQPQKSHWFEEDEASMVDSDSDSADDDRIAPESDVANLKQNHLGAMVARRLDRGGADIYGTHLRAPSSYLGTDNILETYYPSAAASPLNDAQVAAVFWHFVNVTAPSMSLYERHPLDPSPMFQGQPVPKNRQHIWTYTFPILALNHPALLQAMLALGSLQMATLKGVPVTASLKHYHLSLRRIARNYRNAAKRATPATLAATLLLGFYEVWNSDHEKWCKHLWGARALLKEIPLRAMTKAVVAIKRTRRANAGGSEGSFNAFHDGFRSEPEDVDAQLLARLTGRPVNYEYYGSTYDAADRAWSQKVFTEKDIENYEQAVDLYWWYCKMDVYQSILGGTLLLMEYDLWTQVPPRAPLGRINSIYGTFDHIILLLGRLTNFASRDLARKRKSAKVGPPGGMHGGGTAGGMQGGPPAGAQAGPPPGQSPPSFAGMIPTSGTFAIPTGFSPPADPPPSGNDLAEDVDIEESTRAALAEWEEIRQAFNQFSQSLGPDFDPLGFDFAAPQPSPFGPAHLYRTFSIAGIWLNYYMGLILLYRAHPSMPPIAMAAAGMAARQTAPYAVMVGRIAAGLLDDADNVTEVPTVVGAAFIESCFPLFVAGVQYQDHAQRVWVIKRLFDVARLTGWQSARPIAGGCESAWTKAASLGRGPPYERPGYLQDQQPNVWNRPRRIDTRIKELDDELRERQGVEGIERRVVLAQSEQTHFALGLIAVEQDMERLELSTDRK